MYCMSLNKPLLFFFSELLWEKIKSKMFISPVRIWIFFKNDILYYGTLKCKVCPLPDGLVQNKVIEKCAKLLHNKPATRLNGDYLWWGQMWKRDLWIALCVCVFLLAELSTKILILLTKWGHFWEVRTFRLISVDCLRVWTGFKVDVRVRFGVRGLVGMIG